ncbi:acyl carrier protein [Amycolatopsis anabasis]|uniref:acyl carrier protein n=1 Tax=Amycolatopsis anabasis TaxID=1840409 RepID=UPI00131C064A|nr:acyl carrier protein [Amycolatopsis anabasis]
MTTDAPVTPEAIQASLLSLLEARTKTSLTTDQELFASGLVSSMFAMELVVHMEQTFGVAIVGPDLKLDNFRTVEKMTALVLRLREPSTVTSGA